MVHQNFLNQEELKNPAKNSSNPRKLKTPKSSPIAHELGRGIKWKRNPKERQRGRSLEEDKSRTP
jgi:hypothetical protein